MKRLLLVILAMAVGLGVAAPTPLSAQITRTLVVYLGAWSGSISYNVNDMVTYGGLTYISKVANNSGHTPASLSSYWDALSSNAPVATNSTLGLMKPDGTSCTVSAGVLSCSGSGGSGSVVGQTPNYVGLATNANTIGGPSHINESTAGITQVTQTHPMRHSSLNRGRSTEVCPLLRKTTPCNLHSQMGHQVIHLI